MTEEEGLSNLIARGLEGAALRLSSGEVRAGNDLRKLVEEARTIRNVLNGLHSRYNRKVIEQAAIAGVLRSQVTGDPASAAQAAAYIARRLDALADETERGWSGIFDEQQVFVFERTLRGVKEVAVIDQALLGSADARKLDEFASSLQAIYPRPTPPAMLRRKDEETPIHGPVGLFEAVTAAGRKGDVLGLSDVCKVAEIKHLLSEKRFDEAFELSTALTTEAPGNAEGWWRLTVAATALKRWEVARNAVKETINLVPTWPIAWAQFGCILEALKQDDQARKAHEKAISIDPDYGYGHLSLVNICDREKDYDGVIFHGQNLERIGEHTPSILDKIGIASWHKKNFSTSLHYFTKSAALEKLVFRYCNLGLVYQRPELSQDLDASDAYRRALLLEPDHEQALQASLRLSEKLSPLAHAAAQSGTQIVDKTEFYRFYINPFVLLGCDVNSDIEKYPTKEIQKLKKALVQEIDLEAGQIESLGGYAIDKSRALGLCDELIDDTTKKFHWIVFQDKRLCDFLHTGDIALFTYDENYFPIATLNALDEPAFLSWLGAVFARQYELVLSRALDQGNLARIGVLLNGRRYIAQQDEDLCFAGASRFIDRRMEPIRNAAKDASAKKPSMPALSKMLIDSNNPLALAPLLNVLPLARFRSFQDEAVRLVRSIAVDCHNEHSDPDLAKEVLQLADAFRSVSVDIKQQLATDQHQVNEIITKDREHEVRITQEGAPLISLVSRWVGTSPGSIEITRAGVRKGAALIAIKDLKAIRWGITITNGVLYSFFLSVQSDQGTEIQISWSPLIEVEKNKAYFSNMVDASVRYALPTILEKINADLDNDKRVVIGNCELGRSHLVILSWFGTRRHEVPWSRVHAEMAGGDVIISDHTNSKVRTAMPMSTTYNAVTIGIIAASRGKQQ